MKKNDAIIEVSKNCFLRVIKEDDVSNNYVNWLNDYEVTKYTEQQYHKHTIEVVKSFVRQKFESHDDYLFGIFYEKMHIGNIKLGPIKWHHKNADISFFIGEKKYWNKGITSSVIMSVVNFGIKDLGLKKINAGYYENNIGSKKIFKKTGFKIEGRRLKNIIFEKKNIDLILVGYVAI